MVQSVPAGASLVSTSLVYVVAFSTGLITSLGPCVAPRYFALLTYVTGARGVEAWRRTGIFIGGVVAAYAVIALSGAVLMHLAMESSIVYWGLSAVLILAAARTLATVKGIQSCSHSEASNGAGFLFGAISSAVVSPCCGPVLVAIGGLASGTGTPIRVIGLAAAFMCGHLAPLVAMPMFNRTLQRLFASHAGAIATINTAVLIALAAYYAVLA